MATGKVTWSPELFTLFELSPHEFEGTTDDFFSRLHPADMDVMRQAVQESMATGKKWRAEHRMLTTSSERWFECRGRRFTGADGRVERMAGMVWDCTERKRMHAQLRLADRMANLGTLTASVAHEINNPLAFWLLSLGNVDRALLRLEQGAPLHALAEVRRTLAEMRASAEQVREIVRDLRLFSRADEEGRRRFDVHAVLEPALHLVEAELRPRARLVRAYSPTQLPWVEANEARLGQVFLNLLLNAAQATPPGAPERHEVRVRTRRSEEGQVVIEVSDTGSGIPPELVESIFDPFFTTKPVGMGTGLGLSICHNIVASLGGRITVRSAPGLGSTFQVHLPPADAAQGTEKPDTARTAAVPQGRILIVDDAPNLANALRLALGRYEVDAVHSGEDALCRLERERYDCILCDLMMPQMDGVELHGQLRQRFPGLERRMIFFTGGAFTPRAREFLARMENPLLEKPFDLEKLEALISALPPGAAARS